MKKQALLFVVLTVLLCANVVWAIPSTYDFSVTVGVTHDMNVTLGSTYSFDYWWDIPDPVPGGQPWAGLYFFDETGGQFTLWTNYQNQSSTQWQSTGPISIPVQYQGLVTTIRWEVSDFGLQDPNPTVYINNTVSAVPEPGILILLGISMMSVVGLKRCWKG